MAFAAAALAAALAAAVLLAATFVATAGLGGITSASRCSIATIGIATTFLLAAATIAVQSVQEIHQATTAATLAARLLLTTTIRFGITTSWCSVTSGVATTVRSGITTAGVTTTTNT
ncbi:MAG: hypothetical protein CMJ74_04865 [Planctomycetaceae bacterium]|nr:hypothetical protein [Planctomycetaceae bacterium]